MRLFTGVRLRIFIAAAACALAAQSAGAAGFVSVKDAPYSATGDGTTDDTAAIQSAIQDVIAGPCSPSPFLCGGGTLFFPPGVYIVAGTLVIRPGSTGPTLLGVGGATAGVGRASEIHYTGAGTAPLISGGSTTGLQLRNLAITYSSPAFSGVLIDLDSPNVFDTFLTVIDNCLISGIAPAHGAAALVSFNHSSEIGFFQTSFSSAQVGLRGRKTPNDYASVVRIEDCGFRDIVAPIRNAGQDWRISGNNFVSPTANRVALAYDHDVSVCGNTVRFSGNWFGDSSQGGTWIHWCGNALTLDSNFMGGDPAATALRLDGGSNFGVHVQGNDFEFLSVALDLGSSNTGIVIQTNSFVGISTPIANGVDNTEVLLSGNRGLPTLGTTVIGTLTASRVALAGGPSWSSGSGAPGGSCSTGSLYTRTDGTAGLTLYICEALAWHPR